MSDRIEREIDEILRKLDNVVPGKARRPIRRVGQPFSAAQSWLVRGLARISLKQVMMWSLFTVIVTFFLRAMPGASWVMIGALIVFITAFFLSRAGGGNSSSSQGQKRWRGQPLDLSGPSWPNRLKAWIKGRKRA
jgi:hypothetical protein